MCPQHAARAVCPSPYLDCDNTLTTNGCEVNGETDVANCGRCAPGYCNLNGQAADGCEAPPCPAGSYSASGCYATSAAAECSPCPVGTWSSAAGAKACTPCDPGWTTALAWSTGSGACVVPAAYVVASYGSFWYLYDYLNLGFSGDDSFIWSSFDVLWQSAQDVIALMTRQIFVNDHFLGTAVGGWLVSSRPVQLFTLPGSILKTDGSPNTIRLRGMNRYVGSLNPAGILAGIRDASQHTILVTDGSWTRSTTTSTDAWEQEPFTAAPQGWSVALSGTWIWSPYADGTSPSTAQLEVFRSTVTTTETSGDFEMFVNNVECSLFVNEVYICTMVGGYDQRTFANIALNGGTNTVTLRCS
ncbi:hypothetical protein HYH03_017091 [Edaphochlamys debaryana]|uniref:Tyrosine-protein kinase ephrin type A/B receptor-like domain-containing protein n=1 Tax=Edaphochlamys debaryana TaxID=47281 RepID=A0A835XJ31_9CHLO|nr:hypothetical protein HYH03_017091 [Edaphochlamys debaryana]|eukprot:KAG2484072.1 hypothetical protein HYH03_017091 [Edaphochlamys debaryana]